MGKRHVVMGVLLAILVSGLCGCQKKNIAADYRDTVSGAVIRPGLDEAQTSEDFWTLAQERLRGAEKRFAFGDEIFTTLIDESKESMPLILVRQDAEGRQHKYEIKGLVALCAVTEDWLYYVTEDENEEGDTYEALWRAPVDGTAKEPLLLHKLERLISGAMFVSDLYVTDSYLIFEGCVDEKGGSRCYRYNLDTGKCVPLGEEREFEEGDLLYTDSELVVFNGCLFMETEKGVYTIDPKEDRITRLMDKEDPVRMVQCGGKMYLTADHKTVFCYEGMEGKPVCVLPETVLKKKLEEMKLWGEDGTYRSHSIEGIFANGGRLYFSVSAEWKSKKDSSYGGVIRGILLSAAAENVAELRHENGVFDYLTAYKEKDGEVQADGTAEEREEFPDDCLMEVYRPDTIAGIVDGKVVLSGYQVVPLYVSSMPSLLCFAYDLETGEVVGDPGVKIRDHSMLKRYKVRTE